MKPHLISIIIVAFLFSQCRTNKKTPPIEEGTVSHIEIIQDMDVTTLEVFVYYTVEVNSKDEEIFTEQIVEGTAEFGVNNRDQNTMIITETGSDRVINTVERTHPLLNKLVFVEIGGDSKVRER